MCAYNKFLEIQSRRRGERGRVKKGRSGRSGRCMVSKFMQSAIVFLACFIICNLKVGGL